MDRCEATYTQAITFMIRTGGENPGLLQKKGTGMSEPPAEQGATTTPEASKEDTPLFVASTQDDLDKKFGSTRKAGRESGYSERDSELLKKWADFGVESIEDVEAMLEAQQAITAELEGAELQGLKKEHKAQIQSIEAERDSANERTQTLEKLVTDFVTPRLEQLPEHYRELLDEWPVEKQAGWLTKNADKLGATQNGGSRPSGSRPTGRAQTVPKGEADKEARESQRISRVSSI